MRSILSIIVFLFVFNGALAQKWLPGHFTDSKGNKETGLIRLFPPGKAPVRDEGFIEFKEDEKAPAFKMSAGELQSFVIGRDSFVVAHAPGNSTWTNKEFDFVKVALDEPVKLYVSRGGIGSGRGRGVSFSPGISTGIGTGGYGSGFAGGVSGGVNIPIGGGGDGEGTAKITYYFGTTTAEMQPLTNANFVDIMSDIMGDEPEVVEAIKSKKYHLGNIEKLIAYFEKVKAAHHN